MPKIILHVPDGVFDDADRQAIAGELVDFCLGSERLPASPYMKSTAWTYFATYPAGHIFMGAAATTATIVSVQVFTIRGGVDEAAKPELIEGITTIIDRRLGSTGAPPVYVAIQEIAESDWGFFGCTANLAAMRASPVDAPALSLTIPRGGYNQA